MRSQVLKGVLGGLIGGVVFGLLMQMMSAPAPDGKSMPMMQMVAMVVRSDNLFVGWLYHLFNSAIIGAVFGALLGSRVATYGSGLVWGALYGFVWWILGGQILMPVLLGMPPFASLLMPPMQIVAIGSLMGHLIYGVILGAAVAWLTQRRPALQTAPAR